MLLFAGVVALCLSMQLAIPASATEILFDGDEQLSHIVSPLPYTYIEKDSLPKSFQWGNVEGKSFLTHMLNQHIPQVRCLVSLVVVVMFVCCFIATIRFSPSRFFQCICGVVLWSLLGT